MIFVLDINNNRRLALCVRLNASACNLAKMSGSPNEDGKLAPWQPHYVALQREGVEDAAHGAVGFEVKDDYTPFGKYRLKHPWLIKDGPRAGFVAYPHMNKIEEFVNAVEATRADQANANVIENGLTLITGQFCGKRV